MTVDEAQELRILSRRITAALVVVAVVAMVFTAVSVTTFALRHGVSPWVAWTLDPMVAVALLAVLLADARLVELGVSPSGWATALRWFAGMATWAMNAWQSVWPDGGFGVPRDVDAAGVVLHSVAPVLLVLLAEAATGYRRVIAERIRTLEGAPQYGRPSAEGVRGGGRPHLEVVVDDEHVRGAAEMVRLPDADDVFVTDALSVASDWSEPWRAPWPDHPDDHLEGPRQREALVAPVVAGWSSTTPSDDHLVHNINEVGDHLDDQAHDHPDDKGWASVPTLDRGHTVTVDEGSGPVPTPAASAPPVRAEEARDAADAPAFDDDLIARAQALDAACLAEHGRTASLRQMQAGLRIGQARAQRLRSALDTSSR